MASQGPSFLDGLYGHVVANNGSTLPQRSSLNASTGLVATDNPTTGSTDLAVVGGTPAPASSVVNATAPVRVNGGATATLASAPLTFSVLAGTTKTASTLGLRDASGTFLLQSTGLYDANDPSPLLAASVATSRNQNTTTATGTTAEGALALCLAKLSCWDGAAAKTNVWTGICSGYAADTGLSGWLITYDDGTGGGPALLYQFQPDGSLSISGTFAMPVSTPASNPGDVGIDDDGIPACHPQSIGTQVSLAILGSVGTIIASQNVPYTAHFAEIVPVDTTGGNVTITSPAHVAGLGVKRSWIMENVTGANSAIADFGGGHTVSAAAGVSKMFVDGGDHWLVFTGAVLVF